MKLFNRDKINFLPLDQRNNKSNILDIAINPESEPKKLENQEIIKKIADEIIKARKNNKPVIMAFGAHLIKNGLSLVLRKIIEQGYVTHLATNGASPIHDWEFAFQGKTEEDVREYAKNGKFGIWNETCKYLNLALILGAFNNKGYGESIAELINTDKLTIPNEIFNNPEISEKLKNQNLSPGELTLTHPFKKYSVLDSAFANKIPITVHPGFGYDIIYTHPLNDGASIGKTSETDFLRFVETISNLEGGVYISIGSAIMSPMIFEKALSMARNLAEQENKKIKDFMIVVNDIQEGNWKWGSEIEPPKTDPAYYLRFCKTFDRMNAREMHYIRTNNKDFLLNLYYCLKNKNN